MEYRYDKTDATAFVKHYGEYREAAALRIYTSRLIGKEPNLVLHGGGNASVKLLQPDLLGEPRSILLVKGSGHDMSDIEPDGFAPLKLDALAELSRLKSLPDREMQNQLLTSKLVADSPDPSVEALLHAFLPHPFVDHTHADAILTITNLENGLDLIREILGAKVGALPYITSGFPLAKAVFEIVTKTPDIEAVVVAYHGIFTFGDTAESSYKRMFDYVSRAEAYIEERARTKSRSGGVKEKIIESADVARLTQAMRGACAFLDENNNRRLFYVESRCAPEMTAIADAADAKSYCMSGVLTPDHVIRTKNEYIFIENAPKEDNELIAEITATVEAFQENYKQYFEQNLKLSGEDHRMIDASPRVFLARGYGLFALGLTRKDAMIAADIAEHNLQVKSRAQLLGEYFPLSENHIFDMEYWELQRKKVRMKPGLLEGQSAIVTGAGGAIGFGIADRLLAEGAVVIVTDIDETRLDKAGSILADKHGSERVEKTVFDVTNFSEAEAALAEASARVGGIDLFVPNAGLAHVSKIEEMDLDKFDQVTAVNLKGTLNLLKAAAPIFRRQNTGGNVVLVSSKNVFDPGAAFGAYSASKAGAHQIAKIAALEFAELGVRVNMVNPDAVFGDEEISSKLWDLIGPDRMKARGLDPAGLRDYYRQRNLLKISVTAEHVGNAVVFFASMQTPTTGAALPVDGGIPAAFPR